MRRKLLVCCDEPFDRDTMRRIFISMYTVRAVSTFEELRETMHVFEPDVIFCVLAHVGEKEIDEIFTIDDSCSLVVAHEEGNEKVKKRSQTHRRLFYLIQPYGLSDIWDAIERAIEI